MTKPQVKEREATLDLLNDVAATAPAAKLPAKAAPKAKNAVARIEPAKPPTNALDALAHVLKDPNMDPAKMRELFQLYQETEAKQQFHDALLRIDFPEINRDGKIPVRGAKDLRFASFENVHKAVMKLLKEQGFRMSFAPMPGEGGQGLVVECRLIRGTYEEKCIVPISTAPASRAMNAQQAIGAAIKYASRYGIMYLLNLRSEAPEDRDTDGTVTEKKSLRPSAGAAAEQSQEQDQGDEVIAISKEQLDKLDKAIGACGIGVPKFCEHYAIEKVADLPAPRFQEAMDACERFRLKRAAK